MTEIASNWFLDVDVGPEWLFFRLESTESVDPTPLLAERIWDICKCHRIYRIVFELGSQTVLTSHIAGQLVLLHKRCHQVGGLMRICEFEPHVYDVLRIMRLHERFPNYRTRYDAVMGYQPEADSAV